MSFLSDLYTVMLEWKKNPIKDEWVFDRFRSESIPQLSTPEAFDLMTQVLRLLIDEIDDSTALELLQTLLTMARHTQTTEMPPDFAQNMELLKSRFTGMGDYEREKVSELLRYYRI